MKSSFVLSFLILVGFGSENLLAQNFEKTLLSNFKEGWEKDWIVRNIGNAQTKFEVEVENDSDLVLKATSIESASALWHPLSAQTGKRSKLSWRWKIEEELDKNTKLRKKVGDDYAARVIVIFEPHLISWKTHAICYVWAANGAVETMYRSPYSSSFGIVVLQSGSKNRNKWMTEERDPVADYHKMFGRHPQLISAVAIMVDTDNSKQEAFTSFDDLRIEVSAPEKDTTSQIHLPSRN